MSKTELEARLRAKAQRLSDEDCKLSILMYEAAETLRADRARIAELEAKVKMLEREYAAIADSEPEWDGVYP